MRRQGAGAERRHYHPASVVIGILHYASDTPYMQARTLGARGLSYRGMDSTYAGAVAILRRVFQQEGALP